MITISRSPSQEPISRSGSPTPLESQVGGHPGVMTIEGGSLILKPACSIEVAFYQAVLTDPALGAIRPYVPEFAGTCWVQGEIDEEQSKLGQIVSKQSGAAEVEDEAKDMSIYFMPYIVLENIARSFSKPNILDIKLGTVLYDEDANDEKRERMEKNARATTSFETGIRLTGFQVYDIEQNVSVKQSKAYGRSLKAAGLPDGMAKFFLLATPKGAASAHGHLAVPIATTNAVQATGLPADVLLPILERLRGDVAKIRDALSDIHVRLIGASLLVVYEADVERAREGMRLRLQAVGGAEEGGVEVGEGTLNTPSPPYAVKIIDFAHTRLKPGQGPDEGVQKGLHTVLQLLDGRIEQVRASQQHFGHV